MRWWVFTKRPGWLDHLKRFVGRMGGLVEREYGAKGREGQAVLADLLVEAETLDSPPKVVVTGSADLADDDLARQVVLQQFRRQGIGVFDLNRLQRLTAYEMGSALGKAVEAGFPA